MLTVHGEWRQMTINYADGRVVEAILLSRGNDALRVAIQGEDDAQIFTLISGTWVSEEDGTVRIEFAWEHRGQANAPEADCICSKKLASRLISKLLVGSDESDLLDDLLWVLSADGQSVAIHQNQLDMGRVVEPGPRSTASSLPN
jgi:hypothetical protein